VNISVLRRKLQRRLDPHPLRRYATATRLAPRFDVGELARSLERIPAERWRAHLGPYHDGGWEAVSLWAPGGDANNQTSRGGGFAATEVLARVPEFRAVIDAIPGSKNRVRLMRLRAGAEIFRHSDPMSQIDSSLLRLHVPITTNPDVDFRVNDRRIRMRPGELWHIDVRFPHQVANRGPEARVHLVVDTYRNPELDRLLAAGEKEQRAHLTGYFLKHLLPARLLLRLGWAN
jgi:quercetin dioxygenase-like cupin family protein